MATKGLRGKVKQQATTADPSITENPLEIETKEATGVKKEVKEAPEVASVESLLKEEAGKNKVSFPDEDEPKKAVENKDVAATQTPNGFDFIKPKAEPSYGPRVDPMPLEGRKSAIQGLENKLNSAVDAALIDLPERAVEIGTLGNMIKVETAILATLVEAREASGEEPNNELDLVINESQERVNGLHKAVKEANGKKYKGGDPEGGVKSNAVAHDDSIKQLAQELATARLMLSLDSHGIELDVLDMGVDDVVAEAPQDGPTLNEAPEEVAQDAFPLDIPETKSAPTLGEGEELTEEQLAEIARLEAIAAGIDPAEAAAAAVNQQQLQQQTLAGGLMSLIGSMGSGLKSLFSNEKNSLSDIDVPHELNTDKFVNPEVAAENGINNLVEKRALIAEAAGKLNPKWEEVQNSVNQFSAGTKPESTPADIYNMLAAPEGSSVWNNHPKLKDIKAKMNELKDDPSMETYSKAVVDYTASVDDMMSTLKSSELLAGNEALADKFIQVVETDPITPAMASMPIVTEEDPAASEEKLEKMRESAKKFAEMINNMFGRGDNSMEA